MNVDNRLNLSQHQTILAKNVSPSPKTLTQPEQDFLSNLKNFDEKNISFKKADNTQENIYAQIKVAGKVVATIWKSGIFEVPNEYASFASETANIDSASGRTQKLAELLGGEITKPQTETSPQTYHFKETQSTHTTPNELAKVEPQISQAQNYSRIESLLDSLNQK